MKGGNEFRLTGLMSAERVAHIFRMIAAPLISSTQLMLMKSANQGVTPWAQLCQKSYGHGSDSSALIPRGVASAWPHVNPGQKHSGDEVLILSAARWQSRNFVL